MQNVSHFTPTLSLCACYYDYYDHTIHILFYDIDFFLTTHLISFCLSYYFGLCYIFIDVVVALQRSSLNPFETIHLTNS